MSRLKHILLSTCLGVISAYGYASADLVSVNNEDMILLTIDKTSMTARLGTLEKAGEMSQHLRSFEIAIGKAMGDKQVEGDNKTPEGIYFTQRHIDESTLLKSKYGPHAIPLDFPNPYDVYEGKTGYGIWLHGAGDDARIAKKSVTEGCVAFYNNDITALREWLPEYQAVVVIAKDQSKVNVRNDMDLVEKATREWYQGWKNRNMNQYIGFYHPNFSYKSIDSVDEYRQYKSRVFGSYENMKVEIDDLRVITHPKYAVSIMNQDFNGDGRFVSNGRKILFWEKTEAGAWKIIREKFENRRFQPLRFSQPKLKRIANSGISEDIEENG